MTALDKLKEVSALLKSKGIEDPVKEAEMLITEILSIDKSRLYAGALEISEDSLKKIDAFAQRRADGEPMQYIIGHVEFYGLRINVGKGVLIPRPETELLVEEAIKRVESYELRVILDLCTGSGCIALALAKAFPNADVYGIDMSETAVKYASRNASENNIKNTRFIRGDLFEPVKQMRFDCIISNPPYIKRIEISELQKEIRDHEPLEALDGGEDGLDFYRRILKDAPGFLNDNGIIILEIGYNQADEIEAIALKEGLKGIIFIKDYAGYKRIFIGRIH
jgi:release factor glutamine methyltransferase